MGVKPTAIFFRETDNKPEFDYESLEKSAVILKALAHPLRLAIADLLAEYKRLSVTEIYSMLSIEQAIASHHLGILKDKGVLTAERKGKKIFYSLATSKIERILESLA